jgi:hypothetical protein
MQRKSLLFTNKTGGFAAASGFMVFVYFCMMGIPACGCFFAVA